MVIWHNHAIRDQQTLYLHEMDGSQFDRIHSFIPEYPQMSAINGEELPDFQKVKAPGAPLPKHQLFPNDLLVEANKEALGPDPMPSEAHKRALYIWSHWPLEEVLPLFPSTLNGSSRG